MDRGEERRRGAYLEICWRGKKKGFVRVTWCVRYVDARRAVPFDPKTVKIADIATKNSPCTTPSLCTSKHALIPSSICFFVGMGGLVGNIGCSASFAAFSTSALLIPVHR